MDSLGKYVSVLLAVILMFLVPLLWIREKQEALIQSYIRTETTYFIDSVRNLGYMSEFMYRTYLKKLHACGDIYETEIVHFSYRLDLLETEESEDLAAETTDFAEHYEEIRQDDILKALEANTEEAKRYCFRQGDFITIKVKSKNKTAFAKTAEQWMKVTLPTEVTVASYGGMVRNETY